MSNNGLTKAYWTVDGVPMPRNPDNWTMKYDDANVSYNKMASGRARRVTVPKLLTSSPVTLEWHYADWRTRAFVMQQFNGGVGGILHQIEIAGELPRKVLYAYFDTPDVGMSKEAFDTRPGQGNQRRDIRVTGRSDSPYLHSFYTIPYADTVSQLAGFFGGPLGIPNLDYLTASNGTAYKQTFANTPLTSTITNMGNAPWSPTIRFNGPFNNGMTYAVSYLDVDGTGAGVIFTYLGPNVNNGDYITFDTERLRCYASVSGAVSEIYNFTVNAVSTGLPFPYWPPCPPGNFAWTVSNSGGSGANTSIDFTNALTETFRYWP